MIDVYLRFDSRAAMLSALLPLGMTYIDDDGIGHVSQGGHDYAVWEVGEIPNRDGWHLNMRVVNPNFNYSTLEPYIVAPKNPRVIWA